MPVSNCFSISLPVRAEAGGRRHFFSTEEEITAEHRQSQRERVMLDIGVRLGCFSMMGWPGIGRNCRRAVHKPRRGRGEEPVIVS